VPIGAASELEDSPLSGAHHEYGRRSDLDETPHQTADGQRCRAARQHFSINKQQLGKSAIRQPIYGTEQHCTVSGIAAPTNSMSRIDMIEAGWSARVKANLCAADAIGLLPAAIPGDGLSRFWTNTVPPL
jgi:hypothetical protein